MVLIGAIFLSLLPYVYARSAFGAHFPKPLRNPKSFLKFKAFTFEPKKNFPRIIPLGSLSKRKFFLKIDGMVSTPFLSFANNLNFSVFILRTYSARFLAFKEVVTIAL